MTDKTLERASVNRDIGSLKRVNAASETRMHTRDGIFKQYLRFLRFFICTFVFYIAERVALSRYRVNLITSRRPNRFSDK